MNAKKVRLIWKEVESYSFGIEVEEEHSVGERKETGHTQRQLWELKKIEVMK